MISCPSISETCINRCSPSPSPNQSLVDLLTDTTQFLSTNRRCSLKQHRVVVTLLTGTAPDILASQARLLPSLRCSLCRPHILVATAVMAQLPQPHSHKCRMPRASEVVPLTHSHRCSLYRHSSVTATAASAVTATAVTFVLVGSQASLPPSLRCSLHRPHFLVAMVVMASQARLLPSLRCSLQWPRTSEAALLPLNPSHRTRAL